MTATRLFSVTLSVAAASLLWIQTAPSARAQDPDPTPIVGYTPSIVQIQDMLPFTRSYTFQLTSPWNQPPTATSIAFAVSTNGVPAGVSDATALSYISITPSPVIFTAANQIQTVTVTMQLPANATVGAYGYKILATGWPEDPLLGLSNVGTFINATVTAAAQPVTPPLVSIATPADGSTVTVNYGNLPVSVPFTFTATGPGPFPGPIDSVTYSLDGDPGAVTLTSLTGLNSLNVSGTGTLLVRSAGSHSVTVSAHNSAGTATATNVFNVAVNAPPPTVVIDTPADQSTYTYYLGYPSLSVPFHFTGRSTASVVRALSAKLDGQDITFTPSGLNTPTATGTTTFSFNTGGLHTLAVTARDDYGNASTTSTFTINVVTPVPTITIDNPDEGQIFYHTLGTPALNIPFTFFTNTTTGFVISDVSAKLDNVSTPIDSTSGLGTVSATSTGTLPAVAAGSHTLTATGVSAGIVVSTSVNFSVVEVEPLVPPSVVINTPVVGSTYLLSGASVPVTLNFTGTSNMSTGVITDMTATLDGSPLAITWTAGLKSPTSNVVVPVTSVGTHVFAVTATDAVGTASTSRTFTVNAATQQALSGIIFFDTNVNATQDCTEPGLPGITVQLLNSAGTVLATTVSAADGSYSFTVAPGSYYIETGAPVGLSLTTLTLSGQLFTVTTSPVTLPKTGFGLNFAAIRTLSSTALSQGFWKNNVTKNLSKKPNGVQVSLANIQAYTTTIAGLALQPFSGLTMNSASSIFSSKNQLQLQLLAAEYNYVSGAYIGGSQPLTYAFIYWGETVLQNTNNIYNSAYQTFTASWMEAYDTSEGGKVLGPLP